MRLRAHIYRPGLTCTFLIGAVHNKHCVRMQPVHLVQNPTGNISREEDVLSNGMAKSADPGRSLYHAPHGAYLPARTYLHDPIDTAIKKPIVRK